MRCFIYTIVAVLCTVCNQAKAGILTKAEMEAVVRADGYTSYRIAYVTKDETTTRSSIDSYKTFVANDLAGSTLEAQGYGAFTPIISFRDVQEYDTEEDVITITDARDLTSTNPGLDVSAPIYRPDGILLATGYTDFWDGTLQSYLRVTHDGSFINRESVWTGTATDGTAYFPLRKSFSSYAVKATVGMTTYHHDEQYEWINYGQLSRWTTVYQTDLTQTHLYAISGISEVPAIESSTSNNTSATPEPSTAIAMGLLGVVGFAGNRRRRRQVSAA